MKLVIGILLVVHGLIVAAQSAGSFSPTGGVTNPAWLGWWPANLGQSWVLSRLGMEQSLLARAGGLIWLLAGVAFVAAGLGVIGLGVPADWWRGLAVSGAVLSLAMLLVYLHPFYAIGIAASGVVLAALAWLPWPALARLGL